MQKTISFHIVTLVAALVLMFGAVAHAMTTYDEIEIEYAVSNGKTTVEVEYETEDGGVEKTYVFYTTNLDKVWKDLSVKLGLTVEDIEDILAGEYDNSEDEEEEESSEAEAEDAIADAEEEIATAEEVIEQAKTDGKEVSLSEKTLADAEVYLGKAKTAFEAEDYEKAEQFADKAEDLAKMARMKYLGKTADDISDDKKVYICHSNEKTLQVSVDSLQAHLDHGDTKGKCDGDEYHEKKDWKKEWKEGKKDYRDFGKSTDQEELRAQLELLIDLLIELLRARL